MQFKGLGVPNKYFAKQNKQMYIHLHCLRVPGTMKPLKVLSKFENHFAIKTVHFQVSLDAGGYFFAQEVFEFAIAASRASQYHLAIFEFDFTNPTSKVLVGLRPNPIFSTRMRWFRTLTVAE